MKINILQANNLELTDAIRSYAEKKLADLDKFIPEGTLASIDVLLERTTNHHKKGDIFKAEANVSVPNQLLNVQEVDEDLYAAIDKVKDETIRELKRYKEKIAAKQMKSARKAKEELSLTELLK